MVDRGSRGGGSLSVGAFRGTWREGSLAGEPVGRVEKRLWRRASPSIGALFAGANLGLGRLGSFLGR